MGVFSCVLYGTIVDSPRELLMKSTFPEISEIFLRRSGVGLGLLYRKGVLRFTLCWVGKHIPGKYFDENEELPNPRPTQPKKKKRLKGAIGPLFPTANIFSWVGIDFI